MTTIEKSEDITELAKALSLAQSKVTGASKDSTNPHFKSKYADLASVWDACRDALTSCGLSVVQIPEAEGNIVRVTTKLMHTSGQWISGTLTMTAQQNTPQGIGSCITYLRRYSLMSFVGICPEDDDGNAASAPSTSGLKNAAPPSTPPTWKFDGNNKDHVKSIESRMKEHSIAPAYLLDIIEILHDKILTMDHLASILGSYKGK